jgi:hypothetical protein
LDFSSEDRALHTFSKNKKAMQGAAAQSLPLCQVIGGMFLLFLL